MRIGYHRILNIRPAARTGDPRSFGEVFRPREGNFARSVPEQQNHNDLAARLGAFLATLGYVRQMFCRRARQSVIHE